MALRTHDIIQSEMFSPGTERQKFLVDFVLHLADSTLILAQRNSEWCGHGPILEQDIALTNISLDLLGQARSFYQYAAKLINTSPDLQEAYSAHLHSTGEINEDSLAYLRSERAFTNFLLAEQPNGDWAKTTLRQFFFSAYQYFFYKELSHSKDDQLAALAAKSLKEVSYHLRWSSEWVIRLGDGTGESHERIVAALNDLWGFTGEMFIPTRYEQGLEGTGVGVNLYNIKEKWEGKVKEIFETATLELPGATFMYSGGKTGLHTEHLGYILAEMQYLQRSYPGCQW